jgi:glycosyltransferase involved in cell wall biosynthesis
MREHRFILITAAKNEDAYIGETIRSVLRQTVHPMAWFIMDDGSTDRTAPIIAEFAAQHDFIRLHSACVGQGRNFGSQYRAIQAAYGLASKLDFEFIGVQDADISPEQAYYYESMLEKFRQNDRLGIVGGYIYERLKGEWRNRKENSPDSVAGGIQLFRRKCFEQIGGYTPLSMGGSDWLAQLDAGMAGWGSEACPDFPVHHYRPTASANGSLRGWFRQGCMDASFGSHPFFELFKCARRSLSSPLVIGGAVRWLGYLSWKCRGRKALLPAEKVAYLRSQQLWKIGNQARRWIGRQPAPLKDSTR